MFNQPNQKTFLLTESRELIETRTPIKSRLLMWEGKMMTWLLIREYLQPVIGAKKRGMYIVLDERSKMPVSPYNLVNQETKKSMADPDNIALAALSHVQSVSEANKHKIFINDMMAFAILALVLGVVFVAIMLTMGKMDFSDIINHFKMVR